MPRAVITTDEPPATLAEHGRKLWQAIMSAHGFREPGDRETLFQACAASDRAALCAAEILAEGQTIVSKTGVRKPHPLLKDELAARAFVTRALARLRVVGQRDGYDGPQRMGRPSQGFGIHWSQLPDYRKDAEEEE